MQEWPAVGLYNVHAAATTLTSFTRRQSFSVPSLHCNALSFPLTKPFSFGSFWDLLEYLSTFGVIRPSVCPPTRKIRITSLSLWTVGVMSQRAFLLVLLSLYVSLFVYLSLSVSWLGSVCVIRFHKIYPLLG